MKEIYKKVINAVSEQTGVNIESMIHSKLEECVNARAILVYSLYKCGFSDLITSRFTGLTRQGVNKLKNTFDNRRKHDYILSMNFQRVINELSTSNLLSNRL
ncbi:MAG: hypothetical protein RR854_00245 [Muribaculaceae bacterium]